jgi:hypothetical protein
MNSPANSSSTTTHVPLHQHTHVFSGSQVKDVHQVDYFNHRKNYGLITQRYSVFKSLKH